MDTSPSEILESLTPRYRKRLVSVRRDSVQDVFEAPRQHRRLREMGLLIAGDMGGRDVSILSDLGREVANLESAHSGS